MRRKPGALRNIGIGLDGRVLPSFECGYPVELVHGDCHEYLSEFAFDGSELVYSDPPYLHGARKSPRRYRHDCGDADRAALLGLLKELPCAAIRRARRAEPARLRPAHRLRTRRNPLATGPATARRPAAAVRAPAQHRRLPGVPHLERPDDPARHRPRAATAAVKP